MKPINDLYGYSGGDEVLKQCALRLSNSVEGDGYVMRYQGDEFAFIFPNVTRESELLERGNFCKKSYRLHLIWMAIQYACLVRLALDCCHMLEILLKKWSRTLKVRFIIQNAEVAVV